MSFRITQSTNKEEGELEIPNERLLELMQAVLEKGAVFHFRARGMSMSPFIKDGDEIMIVPLSQARATIGRVVAYLHPDSGQLVVHRIVGKQGTVSLLKGDNTLGHDECLVQPQFILGCVARVERKGRNVILGLGPERYLIACLSRMGWLSRLFRRIWIIRSKFRK